MKFNSGLVASRKTIEILSKKFGKNTGGVIAVDSKGKFGAAINTDSMPTILLNSLSAIPKVALNNREITGIFRN